ncbi:MAG TPA: right-handed parallel beta-helix repeat-containing protein [Planctomycetaceae bacterium]|nr:right-handed parallel beta-helix repeat-containing protein [Planctomycetaceae bacterium]
MPIKTAAGALLALAAAQFAPAADQPAAVPPEVHVAVAGADSNTGAADSPLKTLAAALKRLKSAGEVVLHRGRHLASEPIEIAINGVAIRAHAGEPVTLEHGEFRGAVFSIVADKVTIEGLTLDGRFVAGARAVRGRRGADQLTVRRCEVKNFTDHAIDLDGADCRVEDCHIHHILFWDFDKQNREDAHGIVTKYSHRLLIKGCRIHHVSGDCFQGDRGAWQDVTLEDCEFANGAMERDMGGFRKGDSPGEDGIDTKLPVSRERARLIVRRSKFVDFRSSFIETPAAMNLKENVDVVVDGCDVGDAVVAFRLRGTGKGGVMWPTVVNCTIRNCDVAVRYEDDLQKFRFVHNTISGCRRLFERAPVKSKWGRDWAVLNNLLIDAARFPEELGPAGNGSLAGKFLESGTLRPQAAKSSSLIGKPTLGLVPPWYGASVDVDQGGRLRSTTAPTMGAYEATGDR